jgi:hypothetical protein
MTANKNNILAGINGGGTGVSLSWFASTAAAAPTSATSALSSTNTNEVQTATISGAPTGGTFTLTFNGQTTSALAYNATGATVQTAFLLLSSVGAGNATVTGSAGGPYVITFTGALAGQDVSAVAASGAFTGGTSPGIAVVTTTPGVSGWTDAGWCTDKGLAVKLSETVNDIPAFGTITAVRKVITKSEQSFDVEFLESNLTTLAIYNRKPLGSLVTPVGSGGEIDFHTGGAGLPNFSAVFDIVDGPNHIRAYCPTVNVTGKGDLAAGAGQAITYPVTLTAYPDANGDAIYWFYLVNALAV